MKRTYKILLVVLSLCCGLTSCKKYLDVKPDVKLQLPATLADCQALLADETFMNNSFPFQGELSADNYYLTSASWKGLELLDRESYVWRANADINTGVWNVGYKRVLNANQVLETLGNISADASNKTQWNTLKGSALFFRAFSFYAMAQLWTKPYDAATAGQDMGIPIRLTPDVNEATERGTVQHTYDRIIQDLKEAADLLPAVPPSTITSKTTLLTKSAALAALARTYLAMGDYVNAGAYANACLGQYSTLMDYKQLSSIAQYNPEVIFDAQSGVVFPTYFGKIDPVLYNSYLAEDRRKSLFFSDNQDGTFGFKNGYSGTPGYILFTGLATDEVYLIRAECYARAGNTAAAMTDLNLLMRNRSGAGFQELSAASADAALVLVLQERRKELLFRGLRWEDLRRLNKESRFAITLKRTLDGEQYTLPPNDLRYVLLLPSEVLSRVNFPQNPR